MKDSARFRGIEWLVLLMALSASLALEVVQSEGEGSGLAIGVSLAIQAVLLSIGYSVACRRRAKTRPGRDDPPVIVYTFLLFLAVLPCGEELVRRNLFDSGRTLGILLLAGLRNVVLGLAAVSPWQRFQRVGVTLSLFLIVFTAMVGDAWLLYVLLFVFTVLGVWWLMATYWGSLEGRIPDETRRDRPLHWFLLLPAVLVLAVLLAPISDGSVVDALPGFVPSSGGKEKREPFAHRGIGDGDMVVAGAHSAQSFAPVEDAPFVDSAEPSLYDLYNEIYDEPLPAKNRQRSIALSPELAANVKSRMANSEFASREFSTLRKRTKSRDRDIEDIDSSALFYVKGRTPLHLRLEVYDLFDGFVWYPEAAPESPQPLTIRVIDGRPWLDLQTLYPLVKAEIHALKIVRIDTNRIPAPAQLIGIHIEHAAQANLFRWAQNGVVRMDREKLPSLSVIHLMSRPVEAEKLYAMRSPHEGHLRYQTVPADQLRQIVALAERWTRKAPPGWPRIETIVRRLRESYVHDHDARAPADCDSPLLHFLYRSRRGPDYQFATAAAMMLRSLDYPARVVSGFYADPARYNRGSRHTSVRADDVHFWTEVYVGRGRWITIEPTPGYEVLGPQKTFWANVWERLVIAAIALGRWALENALPLSMVLMAGGLVFCGRKRLADGCESLALNWWRIRSPRERILRSLRLLDRRCGRAGHHRPTGMTATRWFRQLARWPLLSSARELDAFVQLVDLAAFAPESEFAAAVADIPNLDSICQEVLGQWTLTRLRRSRRAITNDK